MTKPQTRTNFLGIPVEGDILEADRRVAQRPLEDLQPLLHAVLDDDGVLEFGWRQYTPYFNDGDTCEFGVGGFWVRTVDDVGVINDNEELEIDYHRTLSTRVWEDGAYRDRPLSPAITDRAQRCRALGEAIQSGAFDNVLLEAFGDHAEVTVRRSGIRVEFYSHD